MKAGRKPRNYILCSPYKQIVKSARYHQMSYTARTCLRTPALKEATLQEILKVKINLPRR